MKKIAITGGSGLIGRALTEHLVQAGYQVVWLGRQSGIDGPVRVFRWDPNIHFVEAGALQGVDILINLAGAGIADERWTPARKQLLLSSRVQSANTLFHILKTQPHQIKTLISASGIGYYGDEGDTLLTEDNNAGTAFLSTICKQWEQAAAQVEVLGIQTSLLRFGIVLSAQGGALEKLSATARWGLGAALGTGQQWMSWIHIDDLCRMILHLLKHPEHQGIYNAAAPQPVRNKEFMHILSQQLKRPFWLPAVPAFVLNTLIGELSESLLASQRCSAEKISSTNFQFQFPDLSLALSDLL